MPAPLSRRNFIKGAGATLAVLPLLRARAATNPSQRAQLHYQDQPKDGQRCLSCLEFIPGRSEQALGGCKLLPGDDEISPNGYCTAWNTL